jgi:hypothetical protein
MHERPLSESEEITYHATDLPAPITVGAMLWVAIGFFPLPLALLIHWLMHRMPEWARWLQSLAAYDGAALVAVLLTATVGFGLALLALRQTSDPPLMARLQSCVDSAGLESWQLLLFLIALPIVLILAIVRAAGALELGLLTAIALSVLTARRIKRYPRPAVNLVPAELAAEVEPLRQQQGQTVAYQWSFAPTPESAPELLSLTVAFSPTRLETGARATPRAPKRRRLAPIPAGRPDNARNPRARRGTARPAREKRVDAIPTLSEPACTTGEFPSGCDGRVAAFRHRDAVRAAGVARRPRRRRLYAPTRLARDRPPSGAGAAQRQLGSRNRDCRRGRIPRQLSWVLPRGDGVPVRQARADARPQWIALGLASHPRRLGHDSRYPNLKGKARCE